MVKPLKTNSIQFFANNKYFRKKEQQKLLGDEEKGLKQSRSSIFSTPKSPQINIQFKNLGLHLRTN